jgi:hypothetical protein
LLPKTCRPDLKRSINRICCILLVVDIVVLVMHDHTNIKSCCPVLCYSIADVFLHLSSLFYFDRVQYYWKSLVKCKFFVYQSIICTSSLKNINVVINPLTSLV